MKSFHAFCGIERAVLAGLALRFVKFCLVGGSGVFVDMAVLFLLASPRMLAWPVVISKIVAAEAALVNNFLWNELWTFRERTQGRVLIRERVVRYLKFNAICSGGIVIAVLVLKFQSDALEMNLYLANFLAIVTATAWNFALNNAFNWRVPQSPNQTKPAGNVLHLAEVDPLHGCPNLSAQADGLGELISILFGE